MFDLSSAVVRIRGEGGSRFLGTGSVLAPNLVLTCRHVVAERDPLGRTTAALANALCVGGGQDRLSPVSRVVLDGERDLAVLELAVPLDAQPLPMVAGLTQDHEAALRASTLIVAGFAAADRGAGLWRHAIGHLLLCAYRESDGRLAQVQWSGGLPAGCSGGPVLLRAVDGWLYAGTVYLGGESSATSRAIMTDTVAAFLADRGITSRTVIAADRVLSRAGGGVVGVADWGMPNPYRGLAAFREADAPFFHGREAECEALLAAVRDHPLATLLGASGSGKSSLVAAGLVPRLRREGGWRIATFRPGRAPLAALAGALREAGGAEKESRERGADARLLVVVDHCEEAFAADVAEEERGRFFDALLSHAAPVEGRSAGAVLIVLRADFLAHALGAAPLAAAVVRHPKVVLGPLSAAALRRAIVEPGQALGVAFEAGLADRVLEDAAHGAGALPLLAFTLAQLWERRQEGRLTHAAYETIGGVAGSLARYADSILASFKSDERKRLRSILVELVRPGEGTADTRHTVTCGAIEGCDWPLVMRLADARLVVIGNGDRDEVTVELAHESLIRHWHQLRTWVDEDREFRLWLERARRSVCEWQDNGHDDGLLLRGVRLLEAEHHVAARVRDVAPTVRDFIAASRDRQRREAAGRTRVRRTLVGVVAAGALGMSIVSLWALGERDAARRAALAAEVSRRAADAARIRADSHRNEALARQLAAESRLALTTRPADLVRSALLAAESLRRAHTLAGYLAWSEAVRLLPERPLRLEHDDEVTDIVVGPGGGQAASASLDGTVRLWDLDRGTERLRLRHGSPVLAIALDPRGERIAGAGADGAVRIWSLGDGEVRASMRHAGAVHDVAFSPDGRSLASVGADGTLLVGHPGSGEAVRRVRLEGPGYGVTFSHDGARVLTTAGDADIAVWSAEDGRSLTRFRPAARLSAAVFSPDSARIAAAGSDGTVHVWDVATGRHTAFARHDGGVHDVAFSGDGAALLTAGADGTARLWSLASGREMLRLRHQAAVDDAVFSADGSAIVTASADGTARLWDAATGEERLRLPHVGVVRQAVPVSGGRALLTRGADDALWLWRRPVSDGVRLALSDTLTALVVDRGGSRMASASGDGTVGVWEAETGRALQRFDHGGVATALAFAADGSVLVVAGADGSVRRWQTDTGTELARLGHGSALAAVATTADGQLVAAAGFDAAAIVWNLRTGSAPTRIELPEFAWALSVAPSGGIVATAHWNGTVGLWDPADGHGLARLAHEGTPWALAFSGDGRLLATGGLDGTATLWTIADGRVRARFDHGQPVVDVALSADGAALATAAWDGSVRVWDIASGSERARFRDVGHVGAVAFDRTGRRVVSARTDRRIRLEQLFRQWQGAPGPPPALAWRLSLAGRDQDAAANTAARVVMIDATPWRAADLVAEACARLPRNLTPDEWHSALPNDSYRPTCVDLRSPTGEASGVP